MQATEAFPVGEMLGPFAFLQLAIHIVYVPSVGGLMRRCASIPIQPAAEPGSLLPDNSMEVPHEEVPHGQSTAHHP